MINDKVQEIENLDELVSKLSAGSKKKRIAILVSSLSKSQGAAFVALQQACKLSARYSTTIFTFEPSNAPPNVKIESLEPHILLKNTFLNNIYRGSFSFNIAAMLPFIFKLKDFGLIIVHQGNLAFLSYIAKKLWRPRVIFWNHHVGGPVFIKTFMDIITSIYSHIFDPIYWWLIKRFDLIVSVSRFSQQILKNKIGLDSILFYNTIDIQRFKNLERGIIRKRYGIGNDPVILFVGRITPHKGIHLLIEAFELCKQKTPPVKLLIVGKCCHRKYLEELKDIAGGSVIFTGEVSEDELPLYYVDCDVYATCSLFEGFNLPLVEAQACGKPVVAFDIGPHREIVKNGFLIYEGDTDKFGEKLTQLIHQAVKACDYKGVLK
jgi:1,2-diacylglycerol 3-alpha-glucosyltransferase